MFKSQKLFKLRKSKNKKLKNLLKSGNLLKFEVKKAKSNFLILKAKMVFNYL